MPAEETKSRAPQSVRLSARRLLWGIGILGICACIGTFIFQNRISIVIQKENVSATASVTSTPTPLTHLTLHEKKRVALPSAASPDPNAALWVADLYQLPLNGTLTSERITEWKQSFQKLLADGASAVPSIREFLQKNVDVDFGLNGSRVLGYSSARAACFDLLKQIGGADAQALLLETLNSTADPREIATLADDLEQLSPGAYQSQILNAVRDTLTVAADGNLSGSDVAPLFSVLQKYGDSSAVAVLQQAAAQWKYYATMSLAQLQNGTGISTLVEMAQSTGSSRDVALQVLAQVAWQYPDATDALLNAVRQNQIPESLWPYLTAALADGQFQIKNTGNETGSMHITLGNQNFYTAPFSADQLRQQMALINELLSVTTNAVAIAALQHSRDVLSARLSQVALQ